MAAAVEDPPDSDPVPATPTLQSLTPTLQQMILTSGSLSSKDLGRLECVAKKFDDRPLRVLIETSAKALLLRMNDNAHVTMTRVHERKRWLRALHQLETLEPRSLAGVRRPVPCNGNAPRACNAPPTSLCLLRPNVRVPATLRQRSACLQPSAAGS